MKVPNRRPSMQQVLNEYLEFFSPYFSLMYQYYHL